MLTKARAPSNNLPRVQRTALRNLQKDRDLMVLAADKEKAAVIIESIPMLIKWRSSWQPQPTGR